MRRAVVIGAVAVFLAFAGELPAAAGRGETNRPAGGGREETERPNDDHEEAGRTAPESSQPVRIGTLRGPTSVGMAPLLAQPERLGPALEPRFQIYATPDLLVSQILAGQVDISALPTNLAANLYNRGVPLQLLAVSGGGVLYVVADQDLDWEGLRGRTMFTLGRGTTPDILFQALARDRGIDPQREIDLRYSADQTELAQRLIAGTVRLAVLPEPFVTRVINADADLRVVIDLNRSYCEQYGTGICPMTAIVVMRDFAARFPRHLETFSEAYSQGLSWFERHRSEGAAAAAERVGIPAPIIVEAFDRLNMMFVPAASVRNEVEQLLAVFHEYQPESVGGELPGSEFYLVPHALNKSPATP